VPHSEAEFFTFKNNKREIVFYEGESARPLCLLVVQNVAVSRARSLLAFTLLSVYLRTSKAILL